MLSISITSNPSNPTTIGSHGYAVVSLAFSVIENDTTLVNRYIKGTVSWGDTPTEYPFSNFAPDNGHSYIDGSNPGEVRFQYTHSYKEKGLYIIRIKAENFRVPNPDKVLSITEANIVSNVQTRPKTSKVIYGPILPRDAGYPNSEDWSLNSGQDLQILESSVKMLLLTAKGERLMQPRYGTNLKSMLFSPNSEDIEPQIKDDVSAAISSWEPRVKLLDMKIDRGEGNRFATVTCILQSALTDGTFTLTTNFSQ